MENTQYLTVEKLSCYKRSFELSNYVWGLVIKWHTLARHTIGAQLIRSTDSISANIAEGFGRYSKKDKTKFYYIGYASTLESVDWTKKAFARHVVTKEEFDHIVIELSALPKEIHQLINFTNKKLTI